MWLCAKCGATSPSACKCRVRAERNMNAVSVTIEFPNEDTAKRFLAWMSDGGGEREFDHAGGLDFSYDIGKFFCRVTE